MPHHLPEDQQIEIKAEDYSKAPANSVPTEIKGIVYSPGFLTLQPGTDVFPMAMCGGVSFHLGEPAKPFDSSTFVIAGRQPGNYMQQQSEPVKFGHGNDGVLGKHYFHFGSRSCANCATVFAPSVDIEYLKKVGYCDPKLVEIQRHKIHSQDKDIHLCDY